MQNHCLSRGSSWPYHTETYTSSWLTRGWPQRRRDKRQNDFVHEFYLGLIYPRRQLCDRRGLLTRTDEPETRWPPHWISTLQDCKTKKASFGHLRKGFWPNKQRNRTQAPEYVTQLSDQTGQLFSCGGTGPVSELKNQDEESNAALLDLTWLQRWKISLRCGWQAWKLCREWITTTMAVWWKKRSQYFFSSLRCRMRVWSNK